jgi:hypothetical protein
MEDFAKEVAWMESIQGEGESAFAHGDFEISPMPGVSKKQLEDALAALDKAATATRSKFPKVLYGKVAIAKSLKGGVATYVYEGDFVNLSVRAKATVGDVYALCHEFGHRFHQKFWRDTAQKNAFMKLSNEPLYETLSFDQKLRDNLAEEFLGILHDRMAGRPTKPQSELLGTWLTHLMQKQLGPMREASQQAQQGDTKAEERLRGLIAGSGGPVEIPTQKVLRSPCT